MIGNDQISMVGLLISSYTIFCVRWVFVYIGFFSYAYKFTLNTWELSLNSVCSLFVTAFIVASGIEDLATSNS